MHIALETPQDEGEYPLSKVVEIVEKNRARAKGKQKGVSSQIVSSTSPCKRVKPANSGRPSGLTAYMSVSVPFHNL